MNTHCKLLALALAVAACAAPVQAQETIPLIELTNTLWKYLQGECPVGTAWAQPGYDDAPWPVGRAMLAFENNPAVSPLVHTVLQPPSLLGGGAAYFRTHFNWPHPAGVVMLEFSNRVDDCSVLYLNGILLTNAGVSGVPITCTNFGRAAISGDAVAAEVFRIPATLLAGYNVLAAEVHQMNAASGDIVWGCSLQAVVPRTGVRVLQSFDRLFQGDDPTESFQFSLEYDPAVPTTVRFAGFVENLSAFDETGARFLLGWGRTNDNLAEGVSLPDGPEYLMGVRFPPADPVQGPVRVPVEFQGRIGYAPASLRFDVEGLGCCDYFRLVGTLTIEPTVEPELRVSRAGGAVARITWATNFTGFALAYATNLPATSWTAVTNSVSTAGADFSVTVETDAAFHVFRLRKP